MELDDHLHDVASTFRKPKYHVKASVGVLSVALLRIASLLDMSDAPKLSEDGLYSTNTERVH